MTDAPVKGHGDPIIMYLIVRESLNMGSGKIAAQCGHGVQMVMSAYLSPHDVLDHDAAMMKMWLDTSYRKVVLKSDDKEWEKLKCHPLLRKFIVKDAGLTEVASNSETVMVFWPMLKSSSPKLIKRLRTL